MSTLLALVGRGRETALLEGALEAAASGRGSTWLVTGPAGMGKSRLVEHVADRAERRGLSVARGHCWEAGGAPAYWPWVQVLRSVLALEFGRRAVEQLGNVLAPLGHLLPELHAIVERVAIPRLEPEKARFQLFDAFARLLRAVASERPILIALEDIHVADTASASLLDFMTRTAADLPAVIIATMREPEAVLGPAGPVLTRVGRSAHRVDLSPLQPDDALELARAITPMPVADDLAAQLHAVSEGNPLFVVELARVLGRQPPTVALSTLGLPHGVTAAIRGHLEILSSQSRDILAQASVLGRTFAMDRLLQLVEPLAPVTAAIEEGLNAALLVPAGEQRYGFSHILVREVLHGDLSPQRRTELHLQAASMLETAHAGPSTCWSEVVMHLRSAGPAARERTKHAAVQAAKNANRQFAFAEGAQYFRLALDSAPANLHARDRCDLLLGLARSQLHSGDTVGGRRTCQDAYELAKESADAARMAEAALAYGSVFVYGEVDRTLVSMLERTLSALSDEQVRLRAQVMARVAAARQPAPEPAAPIEQALQALDLARSTDDPATVLVTLRSVCSTMMDLADPAHRIFFNREHAELAEALDEPLDAWRAHLRMIFDELELGDLAAADLHLMETERIAQELDLPHLLWQVTGVRAMRETIVGRFDSAREHARRAAELAERATDPNAARSLQFHHMGWLRAQGRDREVLAVLPALASTLPHSVWRDAVEVVVEGSCHARLGDPVAAIPAGTIDRIVQIGDPMILAMTGEIAAARKDTAVAQRLRDALLPRQGRIATWGVVGLGWDGPNDRVLGLLEAALGDLDGATHWLRRALEQAEKLGAMPEVERVRADLERLRRRTEAVPKPSVSPEELHLMAEGEAWILRGADPPLRLRDTKGVRMLARLLGEPGREFHVIDLAQEGTADTTDRGHAGPLIDEEARDAYRQRIRSLRGELEEAESWQDQARAQALQAELDAIAAELSRAMGLGGRTRQSSSATERARVNVQRRIRDALRRVEEKAPAIGRRLTRSIRTGTYCAYEPD